jgi:hypothetical protein
VRKPVDIPRRDRIINWLAGDDGTGVWIWGPIVLIVLFWLWFWHGIGIPSPYELFV